MQTNYVMVLIGTLQCVILEGMDKHYYSNMLFFVFFLLQKCDFYCGSLQTLPQWPYCHYIYTFTLYVNPVKFNGLFSVLDN